MPWNGAEQVPGGVNGGYCPHSEVLFATWHRPYVALFEVRLEHLSIRCESAQLTALYSKDSLRTRKK